MTQGSGMWSLGAWWDHCAARSQCRNRAERRIKAKLNLSSVADNSFRSGFPAKSRTLIFSVEERISVRYLMDESVPLVLSLDFAFPATGDL